MDLITLALLLTITAPPSEVGESGCYPIPHAQVRPTPRGWYLEAFGDLIPFGDSRLSNDEQFWRCRDSSGAIRGFFIPSVRT